MTSCYLAQAGMPTTNPFRCFSATGASIEKDQEYRRGQGHRAMFASLGSHKNCPSQTDFRMKTLNKSITLRLSESLQ